jgi:hypothetical protein
MNTRKLEQITNTVTQHVQSTQTPLKEKAILILTNSGWMHEKVFGK